jgi:hypothetical protein
MNDLPATADLDLRAELARIDVARANAERARAETEKFVAEQQMLIAESGKLAAEAQLLDRTQRWLPPALAITPSGCEPLALIGGLLGVATFIAHLMGH